MATQLAELLAAFDSSRRVLILPHNNPDPDAIASAVALSYLIKEQLGVPSRIAYKGIIGRSENRALVRFLDRPLRRLTPQDLQEPASIALVDTQPGIGNSAVDTNRDVHVVIDHHPCHDASQGVRFADIRPEMGATSTILTEYLRAAGVQPTQHLATALFYGIKTDTLGLVRGATAADIEAYLYLQPYIDVNKLIAIENAQLPAVYFRQLDAAVQAAHIYNDLIMAYIGVMDYPDLAGEMADLLLRLEGMDWSICLGTYRDQLIFSVRTRRREGGAGWLARSIVDEDGSAGGHGTMAGGQVPLHGRDAATLAHETMRRVLHFLDTPPKAYGMPLLDYVPLEAYDTTVFP